MRTLEPRTLLSLNHPTNIISHIRNQVFHTLSMITQQDIFVAGSESHLPMLSRDSYIQWLSRIIRYAKSKPNGKLLVRSTLNGPYQFKEIEDPGDATRTL